MKSCAFFGHRNFDYMPYCEKIKNIIVGLIEQQGIVEFCSGYRGNFDKLCAQVVWKLKRNFPQIKNTMVL
mgnify:FL=1